MRSNGYLGNTRFARAILKCDTSYVESIAQNYFGENLVIKAEKVLDNYYPKPEFTCDLCGAGNKSRGNRPACFYPTEVGYVYACRNCNPSLTLYQYLLQTNSEVAKNYQFDRWVKKLAGQDFNCPQPPKNARREYYQRIEEEQKEKNRIAYLKRNGES